MTAKQYKISDLLENSVQEFEDLDQGVFDALSLSIEESKALAVPVVISGDTPPVLLDGHQRLRVLLTKGRTHIPASDVRIIADASGDNAVVWSVKLNNLRRHWTTAQKRDKALELRQKFHWSDSLIADAFGVSRAAVGQWLKGEPKLELVVGKDGVMQPPKSTKQPAGGVKASGAIPATPVVDPWVGEGSALRQVVRLSSDLEKMISNTNRMRKGEAVGAVPMVPDVIRLGQQEFDFVKNALETLRNQVGAMLTEMLPQPTPEAKPTPSKKAAAKKAPEPEPVQEKNITVADLDEHYPDFRKGLKS